MKYLLVAFLTSLSLAQATELSCKTTKKFYGGVYHTVKFELDDMDTEQPSLNESVAVSVEPEDSPLQALSENWVLQKTDQGITIKADSDGFYLIKLDLNKLDGYKSGHVKIKDISDGIGSRSSDLECSVNE